MASLKEVKNRIATVNSTRKITSAMKMVASSKLHKAQQALEALQPYTEALNRIKVSLLSSDVEITSPYVAERAVKKAIIVLFTSNSSLCGGFNGNAIKHIRNIVKEYRDKGIEIVRIVSVGKKGNEAVKKLGFSDESDNARLLDRPTYSASAELANELMKLYADGDADIVEIVYHRFKNSASQILSRETFLPMNLTSVATEADPVNSDYIIEPSKAEIIEQLIPQAQCLSFHTYLLNSLASEHAARVIAMQVATDNADELLSELTLTYNKTRQQAITTELLDIVGGSMQ